MTTYGRVVYNTLNVEYVDNMYILILIASAVLKTLIIYTLFELNDTLYKNEQLF